MKQIIIIVSLAFVLVSARDQTVKLGECPKSEGGGIGICTFDPKINCISDDTCRGNQKCCPNGCSSICKDPIRNSPPPPPPSASSGFKPGVCPRSEGTVGICSFDPNRNCDNDGACAGRLKCCPDGCGNSCKAPVNNKFQQERQKLGRCPRPKSQVGICSIDENSCENDTGCPNNLKCCNAGCGKSCVQPILGRRASI